MKKFQHKHLSPDALYIKKSTLPGAGKGLFTREPIEPGQFIVEYKGVVTTWKAITDNPVFNAYVYYVNKNYVIDAKADLTLLARYANDASGLTRVPGIRNNAVYETDKKKIYIQAAVAIPAGGEILVAYGKEYWDVIRYNLTIK